MATDAAAQPGPQPSLRARLIALSSALALSASPRTPPQDAQQSTQFLRWKESEMSLTLLAKDYAPTSIMAAEFVVQQRSLGMLVGDTAKNLQLFEYQPLHANPGRLVAQGEFHLGSCVNKILRFRTKPSPRARRSAVSFASIFGTLDGGVGQLVPLGEKDYRPDAPGEEGLHVGWRIEREAGSEERMG